MNQTEMNEWRDRIGTRVMHAMTCTHEGDDFGGGAVCATCFTNTQRIGAIIEAEVTRGDPRRERFTDGHMLYRTAPGHRGVCECGQWRYAAMYGPEVVAAHAAHVAKVSA
jgi:hypothetical protein